MELGYACINNTLAAEKIVVNRAMVKRTFEQRGVAYASELALKNITDFDKVIDWNIANGFRFYRMSSDMFPWMSEYEIGDLPDIEQIELILNKIGVKAKQHGLRLTFHPGQFNVLASSNPAVVKKTVKELRQHGEIMDMMKLPLTSFSKINIHIGAAYGDKLAALNKFAENFTLLPSSVQKRLTVENDDKANMFSVADLMTIHRLIRVPVVFDYFHHRFCTGNLSEEDALKLAVSTWPEGITPVVHYSSSRKDFENSDSLETAHADYVYEAINDYGLNIDVMVEAKAKEAAIRKYNVDFQTVNY